MAIADVVHDHRISLASRLGELMMPLKEEDRTTSSCIEQKPFENRPKMKSS